MKRIDFNPFTISAIKIEFTCSDCSAFIQSEEVEVPLIYYMTETAHDSEDYNISIVRCGNCNRKYNINVNAGYGGGYVTIEDLPHNYPVRLIEIEDQELEAILSNTEFYKTFRAEIEKIEDLNNAVIEEDIQFTDKLDDWYASSQGIVLSNELIDTLRKLLYTNVITCLESYLSSAYINTIVFNSHHLKIFFETFEDFKKEKFPMSKLFELKDKTQDVAKKAMLDIVYHNLKKISPMYKDSLGVIFPDFSYVANAINIRHDIVHRNGKTKEGNVILISKDEIKNLIVLVDEFVSNIDQQIKKIESSKK